FPVQTRDSQCHRTGPATPARRPAVSGELPPKSGDFHLNL
ncbi:unnamed protein product, partial [Tenebrio molitor]